MDSSKHIQELFTDDSDLLISDLDNVKVNELMTEELNIKRNYPLLEKTALK